MYLRMLQLEQEAWGGTIDIVVQIIRWIRQSTAVSVSRE